MKRVFLSLAFSALVAVSGCAADPATEAGEDLLTTVTASEQAKAQAESLAGFHYESLTPSTTKIMSASRWWMKEQDKDARYPKPRMCANNVSKVLFLAGLTDIDQEGVRNLIAEVDDGGGKVVKMERTPAKFAKQLNGFANGKLPAGTILAGMNVHTSAPGDQHIGFIGHSDPDGTVWIYHNNWYRPANEDGARKPFMVSQANLDRGFERQWMATPWVKLTRDASGKITDAKSLLPALDDMDPFNESYQVTLALLPESVDELGL